MSLDKEIIEKAESERDEFLNARSFAKNKLEDAKPIEIQPLNEAAFYGLAGRFIKLIEPHSESDPAAVLVSFLVGFGNIIGSRPRFIIEASEHAMRIFAGIVGKSSKSRKGTGWRYVEKILNEIDQSWRIISGLSSGEGIIAAVRDRVIKDKLNKNTNEIEEEVIDEGVSDKRLLVIEEEFSAILKNINRQGNILSQVVRSAWDRDKLETVTKNNPTKATGAHISIVGHITVEELLRCLTSTEISNGFGNRFLWVYSKRSKELPNGGNLNKEELNDLIEELKVVVNFIHGFNKTGWSSEEIDSVEKHPSFTNWPKDTQVTWSKQAQLLWDKIYHDLSQEELGIVGSLTSRGEAYVCRLSSIYALLDFTYEISVAHLRAAIAIWDYSYASVNFIFHGKTGDPLANKITEFLRSKPSGATRTDISNYFTRNIESEQLSISIETLLKLGQVNIEIIQTNGKPRELISLNSLNSYKTNKKTFLQTLDEYISELGFTLSNEDKTGNEKNELNEFKKPKVEEKTHAID